MIPLNDRLIADKLTTTPLSLNILQTVDSTNLWLKNIPYTKHPVVCCAETQTQGRGRLHNNWHSPFGSNIYCSIRYPQLPKPAISLVVGIAVVQALAELKLPLKIKWPNDIVINDQKLAGILIETHMRSLIIGIGINVNSIPPHKDWCSLYSLTGENYDRNILIACLLNVLNTTLQQFNQDGFHGLQAQWTQFDALYNRYITLQQQQQTLQGLAQGVDANGELLLLDPMGKLHHVLSGVAHCVRPSTMQDN